jgi:hypothetical protein
MQESKIARRIKENAILPRRHRDTEKFKLLNKAIPQRGRSRDKV